MTVNSLSLISSTPFTGLGTQTYNVPATGRYTLTVNATLPWASGATANLPSREVQTVTTVADSGGSLNSKFFTFYNAGNITGYYLWYNINSAGVDPAPAGFTSAGSVAGATNVTANTLATASRAALVTAGVALITGATNTIIITNTGYGACTAAADGSAATGFGFSVGTTGTYGEASGLNIIGYKNSTSILALNQPTPTQPMLAGGTVAQCTAGDVLTVVLSSLAAADARPNAVKGVINIYLGG